MGNRVDGTGNGARGLIAWMHRELTYSIVHQAINKWRITDSAMWIGTNHIDEHGTVRIHLNDHLVHALRGLQRGWAFFSVHDRGPTGYDFAVHSMLQRYQEYLRGKRR